jgi:lysocardiolipin and lysophospholipid acyltransferase
MHWRRFAVSSIPSSDAQAFDKWLNDRWIEKDDLIEYYKKNGHFPFVSTGTKQLNGGNSSVDSSQQVVVKRAGPKYPFEFIQIFGSLLAVPVVWKILSFTLAIVRFFTR